MKRPSRSMINGTAITLAIIAAILILLLALHNCSGQGSAPTTPTAAEPTAVTIPTAADTTATKKPRRTKKSTRQKTPRPTPERSPLDEEIPN